MFQNIGISEFVLIAIVALILFGPDKLPEIGRKLGKGIREFRSGYHALIEEVTRDPDVRAAERRAPQHLPAAPQTRGGFPTREDRCS